MYQLSQDGARNGYIEATWNSDDPNEEARPGRDVEAPDRIPIFPSIPGMAQNLHRGLNNWIALATKADTGCKAQITESQEACEITSPESTACNEPGSQSLLTSFANSPRVSTKGSSSQAEFPRARVMEQSSPPVRYQSYLSRKASQLAGLNTSYKKVRDSKLSKKAFDSPNTLMTFAQEDVQSSPHYATQSQQRTAPPETDMYEHTVVTAPGDFQSKHDLDSPTLPSIDNANFGRRDLPRAKETISSRDSSTSPTLTELVAEVNENRISMSIYSVTSAENDLRMELKQAYQSSDMSSCLTTDLRRNLVMVYNPPQVLPKSPRRRAQSPLAAQSSAEITHALKGNSNANTLPCVKSTPLWSPSLIKSDTTFRRTSIHTVARSKYSSSTCGYRNLHRHESSSSPDQYTGITQGNINRKNLASTSTRMDLIDSKSMTVRNTVNGRHKTVLGKRQSQRYRSSSEDSTGEYAIMKQQKHTRFDLARFKILDAATTTQLEQDLRICENREVEVRAQYSSLVAKRKEIQRTLDSLLALSIPSMIAVCEMARSAHCMAEVDDAIIDASKEIELSVREHADIDRRLLEHTVALAMKDTQLAPGASVRPVLPTPPPSPECHELDTEIDRQREAITSAVYTEAAVASLLLSIENELHAMQNRSVAGN